MAAGLLRTGARVVGLDVQIASAGTLDGERPVDPMAVAVMADRGIDVANHRSHRVAPIDIEAADLVLAMAQEHVLDITATQPRALQKTYTIKEFVRRGSDAGPRPETLALSEYLVKLDDDERRRELLRRDPTDDVDDPLGLGRRAFLRTAEELDGLVWATLDLLAGYEPRH